MQIAEASAKMQVIHIQILSNMQCRCRSLDNGMQFNNVPDMFMCIGIRLKVRRANNTALFMYILVRRDMLDRSTHCQILVTVVIVSNKE